MTETLKLELQLKMMKSDLLKYLKEYHINYYLFHFLVSFCYELHGVGGLIGLERHLVDTIYKPL